MKLAKLFFYLATTLCFSLIGNPIAANILQIQCSNQNISINTASGEMQVGKYSYDIDWSFDGEWIRTVLKSDRSKLAFNVSNGWIIQGGKSRDANCIVKNPNLISLLALSPGSYARSEFLALPIADRRIVQTRLKEKGHYEGRIDALWGSGTFRALMEFSEFGLPEGFEFSTAKGASKLLKLILSNQFYASGLSDCEGCIISIDGDGTQRIEDGEISDNATTVEMSNTVSEPKTACGAHPFIREKWIQNNSRKFNVWAVFDEIELGERLIEQGRTKEAEAILRKIVGKFQLPSAQYALAAMYNTELGEIDKALPYFLSAASSGHTDAAYIVALYYFKISDVANSSAEKDTSFAFMCVEYAAKNGSIAGMKFLAGLYYHDTSFPASILKLFPRDLIKAKFWTEIALSEEPSEDLNLLEALLEDITSELKQEKFDKQLLEIAEAEKRRAEISQKCTSKAFTMKEICLLLPPQDIAIVLTSLGFFETEAGIFQNNEGSEIRVWQNSIEFSCGVFDACELNLLELGEALIAKTSLTELEPNRELENFGGTSSVLYESLCGAAPTGERVCVSTRKIVGGAYASATTQLLGFGDTSIRIHRSRLGKSGITFD